MKLAILLHGLEPEKEILNTIMLKVQSQLNKTNGEEEAEALYYIDNGESSVEEKQQWLKDQTEAKKYVFITAKSIIEDNFVLLRLNAIKYGKPTEQLVELGIYSK